MLAELIDAVVGVDTHRDTRQVEIAYPTGAPIATTTISNDSTGYAELLAWIFDHTPGPRLAVSIEGTRSYGVGLARAVAAAGLLVIECEQPNRKARRGRGKSDRAGPSGRGLRRAGVPPDDLHDHRQGCGGHGRVAEPAARPGLSGDLH
jgi:hypothetical protein